MPPDEPDDPDGLDEPIIGEPGEDDDGGFIVDPDPDEHRHPRFKYVVDDVPVFVVKERVQYYGNEGKLITESLRDYTRKSVFKEFKSLDSFLNAWNTADRKSAIIQELENHGVLLEPLAEEVGLDLSRGLGSASFDTKRTRKQCSQTELFRQIRRKGAIGVGSTLRQIR